LIRLVQIGGEALRQVWDISGRWTRYVEGADTVLEALERAIPHFGNLETSLRKRDEEDDKTRTHFSYRIDTSTKPDGESLLEHIAGVEDYELAVGTFRLACERWPNTPITLRQGARVIEDSRRVRLAWSDKGRSGGR
jgi:hypothetical protein